MSTKEIVKALRKIGATCRKKPKEEQYVCYIEDKGRVEVLVNPYTTEIRLITDEETTEFYYNFGGRLEGAVDIERRLEELLGARVDIKTVGKGKGFAVSVYTLSFDTEQTNPDKIAKIVKNIVEKDIWVDIRYTQRINLKKGDENFRDIYEFAEELLG